MFVLEIQYIFDETVPSETKAKHPVWNQQTWALFEKSMAGLFLFESVCRWTNSDSRRRRSAWILKKYKPNKFYPDRL